MTDIYTENGYADRAEYLDSPAFYLSFDCPDCGKQWGENARVRRDACCPRCGVVSRYTRAGKSRLTAGAV